MHINTEWALGFESPKAVYESGPTGFHLCRALRALAEARADRWRGAVEALSCIKGIDAC